MALIKRIYGQEIWQPNIGVLWNTRAQKLESRTANPWSQRGENVIADKLQVSASELWAEACIFIIRLKHNIIGEAECENISLCVDNWHSYGAWLKGKRIQKGLITFVSKYHTTVMKFRSQPGSSSPHLSHLDNIWYLINKCKPYKYHFPNVMLQLFFWLNKKKSTRWHILSMQFCKINK